MPYKSAKQRVFTNAKPLAADDYSAQTVVVGADE
jgi:hypothetical protein